ncbi:MAG: peroxiredoxin [Chloroflexi bacterium]|nr:peroxiredoxin [Chloroflexota bacterium]
MPVRGDPAPDFALPDERGAVHRLADQRGRWTVVYFYPEDDTPGCTVEACAFRDANDDLVAAGATVWGISPDDAASHVRFRTKFVLNFTLLSDAGHAVADRYGAWGEKIRGGKRTLGILRSTFLVGPDGRIARAWPKVTPDGHAAEVREALAAARAELDAGRDGR